MKRIRIGGKIINGTLDNICNVISSSYMYSIWFGCDGLSMIDGEEWKRVGEAITSNTKITHIDLYPPNTTIHFQIDLIFISWEEVKVGTFMWLKFPFRRVDVDINGNVIYNFVVNNL